MSDDAPDRAEREPTEADAETVEKPSKRTVKKGLSPFRSEKMDDMRAQYLRGVVSFEKFKEHAERAERKTHDE